MVDSDFEHGGTTEEGNGCFSDEDEESCDSHFHSTADGDFDCSSEDGDLESGGFGGAPKMVEMKIIEKNCRICHLSLVNSPGSGYRDAIELGCCCRKDLGSAHKQCAETWFKIRGNKTCEICNAMARNVIISDEATQRPAAPPNTLYPPTPAETQNCCRRFLNFLLVFMISGLVISWLFHLIYPQQVTESM